MEKDLADLAAKEEKLKKESELAEMKEADAKRRKKFAKESIAVELVSVSVATERAATDLVQAVDFRSAGPFAGEGADRRQARVCGAGG